MIRLAMQLIAYVCVATIIVAGGGWLYLKSTGKLTDAKAFQIWALIHDVDLDEIAEANRSEQLDVPPEEVAFETIEQLRSLRLRDYEIKIDHLESLTEQFNHTRELVDRVVNRLEFVNASFDERMRTAETLAQEEGNAEIARHWTKMKEPQIKEEIRLMIDNDQMELVVMLLKQMPENKLKKILGQFREPQDVSDLKKIHDLLRDGVPKKEIIDQARAEADAIRAADD